VPGERRWRSRGAGGVGAGEKVLRVGADYKAGWKVGRSSGLTVTTDLNHSSVPLSSIDPGKLMQASRTPNRLRRTCCKWLLSKSGPPESPDREFHTISDSGKRQYFDATLPKVLLQSPLEKKKRNSRRLEAKKSDAGPFADGKANANHSQRLISTGKCSKLSRRLAFGTALVISQA
jgi:hypothetical protein